MDADRRILDAWTETASAAPAMPLAHEGFSGARVFRIAVAGGPFALRQWPADGPPAARLRELHRFLSWLRGRGVTEVAVPVASRAGDTLVEHRGRLWQLEPWLPGTADFHRDPSDARLASAMQSLARLHLAAADYEPASPGREWFFQSVGPAPAVVERLRLLRSCDVARVRQRIRPELLQEVGYDQTPGALFAIFERLLPRVIAETTRWQATEFRLQPCLRDIWHDHVLFSGDAVSGFIDASAARSENVASDLSRLLGSLLGDEPRWRFALEAYAAVRSLSAHERELVRVLDRSGVVLSGLHWLERLNRPANMPETLRARSRKRLLGLLRRIEHLDAPTHAAD